MGKDHLIGSEDEIIRDFLRKLAEGCDAALNLDDDAACLRRTPGMDLVITSDALVAGIHFLPDDSPADIGFKAGAVNVSDLVAKGARAKVFFMSLALPDAPSRMWLADFSSGLGEWVQGKLAGGDLVRTHGPLIISITAIGEVPAGEMVRRTTARVGDRVYVTGTLGGGTAGLMIQGDSGHRFRARLSSIEVNELVGAYRRPDPPVALTEVIAKHASAAMDLSDGLIRDAGRMCKASNVGMDLDGSAVPIAPSVRSLIAAGGIDLAGLLTGGDDYQVLMTVPEGRCSGFEGDTRMVGECPVTHIGTVTCTAGELIVRDSTGRPMIFDKTGHDHF